MLSRPTKHQDELHWHFDCNACAITLGIQVPESGGELEYVPFIGRQNHDAIEQVIATAADSQVHGAPAGGRGVLSSPVASSPATYQHETGEGELIFFCGGETIHRVRPVHGDRQRLVAALQFHTSDDAFDPPAMTQRIYGVNPSEHLGPKRNIVRSRPAARL